MSSNHYNNNSNSKSEEVLLRCYRSAIAFNNMGVSLLTRHAYRQAEATLGEAIALIKMVHSRQVMGNNGNNNNGGGIPQNSRRGSSGSATSSDSSSALSNNEMEEIRKRTTKLVAKIQQSCASKSLHQSNHPEAMPLTVIHLEHSDSFAQVEAALREGPSSPVAFPVHMHVPPANEPIRLQDRDLDVESAIMLQNSALALLCRSKLLADNSNGNGNQNNSKSSSSSSASQAAADDLRADARRIFKTVFSVIMATRVLISDESSPELAHILLLEIVVVSNIMLVLTFSGKADAARSFYCSLVTLREQANELQESTSSPHHLGCIEGSNSSSSGNCSSLQHSSSHHSSSYHLNGSSMHSRSNGSQHSAASSSYGNNHKSVSFRQGGSTNPHHQAEYFNPAPVPVL